MTEFHFVKTRPPDELKCKVKQICEQVFLQVKEKARELGWCVIAHGSMERDLDLVAIPWIEDAKSEKDLVECVRLAFASSVEGFSYKSQPENKPHGRRSYILYADTDNKDLLVACEVGVYPFIDLSVIDVRAPLRHRSSGYDC